MLAFTDCLRWTCSAQTEGYVHMMMALVGLANRLQMGPPPNPDAMLEMMDNPMFLSQMNEAMNNPAVVDMMMQSPMVGIHAPHWIPSADMS
jgi:hypothetical protein